MKTKLTKVQEVRTPREINEMPYGAAQTKARREFLAGVVAAKEAEGFVAKIVGKGSYQTVNVYAAAEVETRDQLRGTCQRCGASVAVQGGTIVHHGYERPGYGYIVGGCGGVNNLPAETSIDLATLFRDRALEDAARYDARAAEIDAADAKGERPEVTKARAAFDAARAVAMDVAGRVDAIRKAEAALNAERYLAHTLRSDARSARQYAEFMSTAVLPRLGKDLAIVKIEV